MSSPPKIGVYRRWCSQSEYFVSLKTALLWSAMALAICPAWPVSSQDNPDAVMLNFVNAEIEGVVKAVS